MNPPSGTPRVPPRDRRQRREGTTRAVRSLKAQHAGELTFIERVADRLTILASSTPFLVLHIVWFGGWILWNTGLAGERAFDPFPFGLLTMIVSLEAIFLSIFVLMTQNRESTVAELREEVTLAVNLRMEDEVTKVLQLVAGLYTRLGQPIAEDEELLEMLQPLDAEAIEAELTEQIRQTAVGHLKRNVDAIAPSVEAAHGAGARGEVAHGVTSGAEGKG
jgi:uncharacterized membrane protein